MRAGILAAVIAVSTLSGGTAWAACPPTHSRDCVDFTLLPKISEDIVAGEKINTPAKTAPQAGVKAPYSGPTLGIVPNSGRAATVGYRWAIN